PDPAARWSARRRRMWLTLSLVAVLLIGANTSTTYVLVSQRNATAIPSSAVYFIDANGTERFMASPMVDHTANGKAYLPLAQVSDWSSGIARLASNLARSAR